MNRTRVARLVAIALLVVTLLAGCGSDGGSELSIGDVWARSTADGQTAGAAYMTITGGEDGDRLVAASAPSETAGTTELHETVAAEDGDDAMSAEGDMGEGSEDEMGTGGAVTMREIDGLDVPAGDKVALSPGGYHVMLLDLADPLEAGETFELTLTFEQAGERTVEVEVRDE